jgi:hypothetical protein
MLADFDTTHLEHVMIAQRLRLRKTNMLDRPESRTAIDTTLRNHQNTVSSLMNLVPGKGIHQQPIDLTLPNSTDHSSTIPK